MSRCVITGLSYTYYSTFPFQLFNVYVSSKIRNHRFGNKLATCSNGNLDCATKTQRVERLVTHGLAEKLATKSALFIIHKQFTFKPPTKVD